MADIPFGHNCLRILKNTEAEGWLLFTCGHCNMSGSAAVLAGVRDELDRWRVRWIQCPSCHQGSVVNDKSLSPGHAIGPTLQGLPPEVETSYQEARRCMTVDAFTGAELLCRKILMHVGVEKGEKEGKPFAFYIDYLVDQGYITPPMKEWVELIKDHANEATHEIPPPSEQRARGTVTFTAQLLRMVYEMEHIASEFIPSKKSP